jgi:hypothetical protein
VAAAKTTIAPRRGPSRAASASSCSPGLERAFLRASPLRVVDALLRRVDGDHPPDDRLGEHLPQRLRRFEAVARRHRHPPSRDLDRVELVQAVIAERLNRSGKEEAQLLQRHRRGVMLGEILIDELGERDRPPDPALATQPLERPLQRRPRIPLAREATPLHPLPIPSTDPIAVRPQRRPLQARRCQPEHLTLLNHVDHPFKAPIAEWYKDQVRQPPLAEHCGDLPSSHRSLAMVASAA